MSPDTDSLENFVRSTREDATERDPFRRENSRILEVSLDGRVWARLGSMIAYTGSVGFQRESVAEKGLGRMLKEKVTGEGLPLMKAEGQGTVYFADGSRRVSVLHLDRERLMVNGQELLAFEESVDWDISMMRKVSGMVTGGLFNVELEGTGHVAVVTDSPPLTLEVEPGRPVRTDPFATVLWSEGVSPEIRTDVSTRSLIGRGSREEFQLEFTGSGFVTVQSHRPRGSATGG